MNSRDWATPTVSMLQTPGLANAKVLFKIENPHHLLNLQRATMAVKDLIGFPLRADTPSGTEMRMLCLIWRLAKPCEAEPVILHDGEGHPKPNVGLVSEALCGGMNP
jgi:hypothetical protein